MTAPIGDYRYEPEPTLYVIHDAAAMVVCTDYHVAKALGRALVFVTDRPATIRCGHQETKILNEQDAVVCIPLTRLTKPIKALK